MRNMEFGKALRKIRKECRMTQKEVADYCNVCLRSVSDWELRGIIPKKIETIERLRELFGNEILSYKFGDELDANSAYKNEIRKLKWLKNWHEECITHIDNLLAILE